MLNWYFGFNCRCDAEWNMYVRIKYEFNDDYVIKKAEAHGAGSYGCLHPLKPDKEVYVWDGLWKCISQEEVQKVWESVGFTEECLTPGYCDNNDCEHKSIKLQEGNAAFMVLQPISGDREIDLSDSRFTGWE